MLFLLSGKDNDPSHNKNSAKDFAKCYFFLKEQHTPNHSPDYCYCFIRVCKGKWHKANNLLPPDCVNTQKKEHAAIKEEKTQCEKSLSARFFAAYLTERIEQKQQMKE